MDLVLWRHADAEEGRDDHARRLTPKGLKQAERMAVWLDAHLPKNARLIVSPAVRAQQTAELLDREQKTDDALAPGAGASGRYWKHAAGLTARARSSWSAISRRWAAQPHWRSLAAPFAGT